MTNTATASWCPMRQGGGPRCSVAVRHSAAVWAVALYLYGGPHQWARVPTLPELSMAYCDLHGEFPRPIDLAVVVPMVDVLMRSRFATSLDGAARAQKLGQLDSQAIFDAEVSRWLSAHWSLRLLARSAGLSPMMCLQWGDTL